MTDRKRDPLPAWYQFGDVGKPDDAERRRREMVGRCIAYLHLMEPPPKTEADLERIAAHNGCSIERLAAIMLPRHQAELGAPRESHGVRIASA